jgi:hypothetical protein
MKIKINNKTYSPSEEPIMLIFKDESDKQNLITNLTKMKPEHQRYLMYPGDMPEGSADSVLESECIL